MPLRKCPYCKGLSNFDLGTLVSSGHLNGRGWVSLDTCQNCKTPVYFEVSDPGSRREVADSYPKLEATVDEELPNNIKVAFEEAIESLNGGLWNGCVVMCRRALAEAMDDLGAEGETLFAQIDNLEVERKITPDLKNWAHEGRLAGNLGAHGDKQKKWADEIDAKEAFEFCQWFFRYVYVLPKQLAERKAKVSLPTGPENTYEEA